MRTKTLLLTIMSLFFGMATCLAQNTLNIHQKSGGVESCGFAEKPVLTYLGEVLHVSTDKVSIDYPLAELEKLTFDDSEASVGELRVEGQTGPVCIYRMDGTLVKRQEPSEGASAFNLQEFPAGNYIINHGTITYKITKQ